MNQKYDCTAIIAKIMILFKKSFQKNWQWQLISPVKCCGLALICS